ncbi:MAG: putative tellurite resistance protein B-like protein [Candidatus Endobugula sp.]|jgi:uncharacterized tellurite resistance protein B-like protein
MISRIKALFDTLAQDASQQEQCLSSSELQLASAALLVEVATIDQHLDNTELHALGKSLSQRFSLDSEELEELINTAQAASKEASSLYQFTQLINRHCNDAEKYELTCGLWSVAYADDVLDKHEEHIIRRIADLIHLRHSDFIRAKHHVRDA